jgi:glycosyltransferase involved in cell wall biosynthesis
MLKLSAVIITYNEEQFIEKCLASINGVADEIVVVDSYSTDRTEEICKKYNVRFIKHKFEGYKDQKNYAIGLASYKNVLSLDADEELSDKLRESILAVKDNWEYGGYYINRRNNYCGKWMRFSEWYPNKQLRLFYSDKGAFGELNIHERFIMSNGYKVGKLEGDILHWVCKTPDEHVERMTKYSNIGAEEFHKAGKKAYFYTPHIHYIWGFIRTYIIKGGFLDGRDGYHVCSIYANSAFNKYKKLRHLNKNGISR